MKVETLIVGTKFTKYDYTEIYNGTTSNTEQSNFTDIFGIYVSAKLKLKSKKSHLEFLNSLTTGKTKYIGSESNSSKGYGSYTSRTADTFMKSQLTYVRDFSQLKKIKISLTPSLGFHYWERTLSSIQNEIYYWWYYQLGIRAEIQLDKGNYFSIDYSHQWTINPTMYADTPSLGLDHDFNLGKTESDFLQLTYLRYVSSQLSVEYKVEYERVKIGLSDIVYASTGIPYVEPESHQKNINFYIGFLFKSLG